MCDNSLDYGKAPWGYPSETLLRENSLLIDGFSLFLDMDPRIENSIIGLIAIRQFPYKKLKQTNKQKPPFV